MSGARILPLSVFTLISGGQAKASALNHSFHSQMETFTHLLPTLLLLCGLRDKGLQFAKFQKKKQGSVVLLSCFSLANQVQLHLSSEVTDSSLPAAQALSRSGSEALTALTHLSLLKEQVKSGALEFPSGGGVGCFRHHLSGVSLIENEDNSNFMRASCLPDIVLYMYHLIKSSQQPYE